MGAGSRVCPEGRPAGPPLTRSSAKRRNGTRWSVALALGLRQNEALGLRRPYVDLDKAVIRVHWQITHERYRHGCDDPHACGKQWHVYPCPSDCRKAKRISGRRHFCRKPCQARRMDHNGKCPKFCAPDCAGHAKACPQRIGGPKFTRPKGKRRNRSWRRRPRHYGIARRQARQATQEAPLSPPEASAPRRTRPGAARDRCA